VSLTRRFAARGVVRSSGDLDQAAPAEIEAITGKGVAKVSPALVPGLHCSWPPNFADVNQLTGLVAEQGNGSGDAFAPDNLEPTDGCIEDRYKNAGFSTGVRDDLQQLLRSD
jgi:hypothetical protein